MDKDIRIRAITRGALALALIFLFFTVFRGGTNILNGILTPLVLYINMKTLTWKESVLVLMGLVVLSGLFFRVQLFFAVLYSLLAILMLVMSKKRLNNLNSAIVLSAASSVGIFFTIRLTDLVLQLGLEKALLSISGGSYLGYFVLVILEGLVLGFSLTFIRWQIDKRAFNFRF